jgi:imidazolonepropionase-like amidohydrolase
MPVPTNQPTPAHGESNPPRLTRRAVAGLLAGGLARPAAGDLAASSRQTASPGGPPVAIAIESATVIPMTGEAAIVDATVVIDGGRIVAIGAVGAVAVPEDAVRVDGRGRWVLPALIDMHVHLVAEAFPELPYGPVDALLPFVANGVAQVVDLASTAHTNALRDEIAAGGRRAPRLATARMVDGDPPIWGAEIALPLRTPAEARRAVPRIAAEGYDFVKVYSLLDVETFRALLDAAQDEGIRVVGHLPAREAAAAEVVLPGFALVAHAEEYAFRPEGRSDAAVAEYADLARANGVGLISTLFLDEQLLAQTRDPAMLAAVEGLAQVDPVTLPMWFEANRYTADASPERIAALGEVVDFNRRLVKAFVDAGIPVLAGTDSFIPGVVAGFALHEELGALARAGLANDQILRAATAAPAQWLGLTDWAGTVAVGQPANLLLLDADPRKDIRHTRAIAAVVLDGRLLPRRELDAAMDDLADRYAPVREWFSPRASELLRDR